MLKLLIDRGYLPRWVGSLLFWFVGLPMLALTVYGVIVIATYGQ
jgi:hypothetical protein